MKRKLTSFFRRSCKKIACLSAAVLLLWCTAFSQGHTVKGTVTSSSGTALVGVTVVTGNGAAGTVTDSRGQYHLQASPTDSLIFRSIGYRDFHTLVGNRETIDVQMATESSTLNQIVVVGYGTQKRSDLTGAVSQISAEQIESKPAQNVLQAMQGKAAGVQVSSNMKPGELPVIRVRGTRSLSASNDPLYVLDGIPIINALGVTSFSMSDLNPDDIASIEILKDASATAIYGSRGANGVVLITTKKGQTGRLSVSYNATVSLDQYHSLTHWMNGGQYIDRWREALINGRQYNTALQDNSDFTKPAKSWYPDPMLDEQSMGLSNDPVALQSVLMGYQWVDKIGGTVKMRQTTAAEKALGWPDQVPVYNAKNVRSYDWANAAVRQGITQNHQISLAAGTKTSHLHISMGYYNQLGVQKDQNYKRYTANITGDISPTGWLTIGTSAIASLSIQNYGMVPPNTSNTGDKDLYSRAVDQFPYALPKDSAGDWIGNPGGNLNLWNPLIDIDQVINERRTSAIFTSMYGEVTLTPWLKYRLNFGVQYRDYRNGTWTGPNATTYLNNKPNTAGYSSDNNFSWVAENLLYITKTFAQDHSLQVTLLQSAQSSRRESVAMSVAGLINPLSLWYDLASNTQGTPSSYGSSYTANTMASFMGRVNYSYKDKYLLTASGRYDGASVLANGHKWAFFPSMALAWKMQEESFLKSVNWIDELKPRFGYGVTGNAAVNPYSTSGPLSRNPYVFGSAAAIGYLPQLVQNPLLGWERTAQSNLGVDFSFFHSRLSGSAEVYRQNTYDLIMTASLPAVSGYVQKIENVGKTRNTGVEITLSSVNVESGQFSWTTDLNWSHDKEQIVSLINGKEDMLANRWFIGHPIEVYYQYANAGIWGSSASDLAQMAQFNQNGHKFYPGTVKVVDQNNDHNIDASDMVIRGTPRPKWEGGITNTFNYGNWSLSSFIYFRWGQTYFGGYPNSYGGIYPNGRVENNMWSWTNQKGKWPMPNTGSVENVTAAMQYNNGSFGVIRNISLSYKFSSEMLHKAHINNLVLNFQVLNPYIFGPGVVKWGLNPDDDTNWDIASSNTNPLGGTNTNTVLTQSFVFGLRASF
jgi:TonB-linked SusC/RagA family outer membrane protein